MLASLIIVRVLIMGIARKKFRGLEMEILEFENNGGICRHLKGLGDLNIKHVSVLAKH